MLLNFLIISIKLFGFLFLASLLAFSYSIRKGNNAEVTVMLVNGPNSPNPHLPRENIKIIFYTFHHIQILIMLFCIVIIYVNAFILFVSCNLKNVYLVQCFVTVCENILYYP